MDYYTINEIARVVMVNGIGKVGRFFGWALFSATLSAVVKSLVTLGFESLYSSLRGCSNVFETP